MKLAEAYAARARIEERMRRRDVFTGNAIETWPYYCPGPGVGHFVTDDNPMRTGRCLNCREFVVRTAQGWRRATRRQAFIWGLYGARHRVRHRVDEQLVDRLLRERPPSRVFDVDGNRADGIDE